MSSDADVRHAPIELWRLAGGLLTYFYHLFGDASRIAALHTVTTKSRALMLTWLRAAEAMLRRLLLIEAAAYADESLSAKRARKPRVRQKKLVAFDPDASELWRVSFRALDHKRARRRSAVARRGPVRFHSAWPLALRYEALIRVYNNPAPFARRLASRLRAEPSRAAAILAQPLPSVGREKIGAATPLAEAACARFRPDSS